jgi:ATP-dependent RNA helicase DeaD
LTETLNAHGYRAEALHGGIVQRQRDRVMNTLRSGKSDVLVATDVAARGLDVEHLSHVINYDVPSSPEMYVHRIGRTGRIGRSGVAITLADPREHRLIKHIEAFTKRRSCSGLRPCDLRTRRLNGARCTARALLAGDLDDVRAVVRSLAGVRLADVAAAAVKVAHTRRAKTRGKSCRGCGANAARRGSQGARPRRIAAATAQGLGLNRQSADTSFHRRRP